MLRSLLFAPGNHPRRVAKALTLDCDAVILDLEDACPVAEKVATRAVVVAALAAPRRSRGYVRVNATTTEWGYADLVAVAQKGIDGIVLPKVEAAEELKAVDWVLSNLERERGMVPGGLDLIPIVETGRGIANVASLAAATPRVRRLSFGAGDFTLDMGIGWSRGELELLPHRSQVVLASRSASIEPPIDTVWVDLKDGDGFAASAKHVKGLGFQGKLCIHPDQVPVVNSTFAPTEAEIAWARRVVAAFAAAEKDGSASIQLDGQFIDYPIVHRAEQVIAAAAAIARRSG